MKRLCILSFLAALTLQASAQNISGSWNGVLTIAEQVLADIAGWLRDR